MGITVVIITHEMAVIEAVCDRVAIIDKSHIAEIGEVSGCSQSRSPKSAAS